MYLIKIAFEQRLTYEVVDPTSTYLANENRTVHEYGVIEISDRPLRFIRSAKFDNTANARRLDVSCCEFVMALLAKQNTNPQPFDFPSGSCKISAKITSPAVKVHPQISQYKLINFSVEMLMSKSLRDG